MGLGLTESNVRIDPLLDTFQTSFFRDADAHFFGLGQDVEGRQRIHGSSDFRRGNRFDFAVARLLQFLQTDGRQLIRFRMQRHLTEPQNVKNDTT